MRFKNYNPGNVVEIKKESYIIIYCSIPVNSFYGLVNMKTGRLIYKKDELSSINTIIHNLLRGA